jgi:hypothetical protein
VTLGNSHIILFARLFARSQNATENPATGYLDKIFVVLLSLQANDQMVPKFQFAAVYFSRSIPDLN